MQYLLDTNICIDIIRKKPQSVLEKFTHYLPGDIGVSTITVSEMMYGCQKSLRPAHHQALLEQFLAPLQIVEYDYQASVVYGQIRAYLASSGQLIGPMDMLIAAHALSLGVVLVTNNIKEFQRVEGLALENWIT